MPSRTQICIAALATIAWAALILMLSAVLGTSAAQAQAGELELSGAGVGPARVGSTVEMLSEQLGDEYTVSDEVRVTVDYLGHVVRRDGEVQFRAVKESGTDELNLFIVNNSAIATAEGVGAGMAIADAEAIYGEATLTIDDGAGREFVTFADQPDGRMVFRTPGIGGTFVGEYEEGAAETTAYDPDGRIAAVWIRCTPGTDCPDVDAPADGDDAGGDDDAAGGDAAGGDDDAGQDDGAAGGDDAGQDDGAAGGDDAGQDDGAAGGDDDAGQDDGAAGGDDDAGDDDAAAGGGDTATSNDESLPRTGANDVALAALAAVLVGVGGAFVVFQRYYLAPMWLRSRRW